MLGQIIKFAQDICRLTSCLGQFFVKIKKEGEKGSSIMSVETNFWGIEGAITMLLGSAEQSEFFIAELPNYPLQDNMSRSYLFRKIGGYFMPFFIGIDRIMKEFGRCVPNYRNIDRYLAEYPGMCGNAIQTYLKAIRIEDDAYRLVQEISINPDGSYANAKEFKS